MKNMIITTTEQRTPQHEERWGTSCFCDIIAW
jgi:hypothetical protein